MVMILVYFFLFISVYKAHDLVVRKPKVLRHSVASLNTANIRQSSYDIIKSPTSSSSSPVIILHGLLGSTRNFRMFCKSLANKLENKHDIIVIDLPNHGRSFQLGQLSMNYPAMALDTWYTIKTLNIGSFHLIGHSMGGKAAATLSLLMSKQLGEVEAVKQMKSLSLLDISPTTYSSEDFSSVYKTIDVLIESSPLVADASSRAQVVEIIGKMVEDPSLKAFLLTNIQEKEGRYSWKLHVDEINSSRALIRGFPYISNSQGSTVSDSGNQQCVYTGPTVVIKGSKSTFVRSSHLEDIRSKFPNFNIVTQKDAGHWIHAEQPEQVADKLAMFLHYAEGK